MFGNTGPFSYSPGGITQEDLFQQRRTFHQDEISRAPVHRNNMSRPTGRSIYMQRKEYSEALNRQPDNFNVRVEHLFTCELDGQEVKTVGDCVAKLKRLDAKGRLWPQEMIMEVQGGYLVLSDIETKAELESFPLTSIKQTKSVVDSCAYNSVLTLNVQDRSKRVPQVFLFQCEETGAEVIKSDLDQVIQRGGNSGDVDLRRELSDIRSNLEQIIGQQNRASFRQTEPPPPPPPLQQWRTPPPPETQAPMEWNNREPDIIPHPQMIVPVQEPMYSPDLEFQFERADAERNTEILNHVISDLEIFMDKVSAAANEAVAQEENNQKKKKKKKSKKSKKNVLILPPVEEYLSCLQKVKYGFNLLGQLEGTLGSPSAPDYVHIFFQSLGMLVPQYPADLPPIVLSPLLTEPAMRLLSQVVGPEEDMLWRSLGDSWNIPRSQWPGDDVPPYIPDFYDGWQPPAPSYPSPPPSYQNGPMSRSNSQRFPGGRPNGHINESQNYSPREMQQLPDSSEPVLQMRVIYDFMARNSRELSIMKGEVVQVIQKSKQWWLVRNSRNEQGNVPQNVLEPMRGGGPMDDLMRDTRGPVTLDMNSSPAEVKAWLEYKGFSRITVTSLGVLTGKLLLGMSKDEIRTVCPEEGGKVFFQLQGIKSAIALASEPSGMYNGRY